jgi:hypothetical protein
LHAQITIKKRLIIHIALGIAMLAATFSSQAIETFEIVENIKTEEVQITYRKEENTAEEEKTATQLSNSNKTIKEQVEE